MGSQTSKSALPNAPKDTRSGSGRRSNESKLPVQYRPSSQESGPTIPTILAWTHGGKSVYITGTFTYWREHIPMKKDADMFLLTLELPVGYYEYKFIVDNEWRYDHKRPMVTDNAGNINNFIEIKEKAAAVSSILSENTDHEFGQSFDEYTQDLSKDPPTLPPQMKTSTINASHSFPDPVVLPVPSHVVLGHVYTRNVDEIVKLAMIHRYRAKFVTTIVYRPASSYADGVGIGTAIQK